MARTAVGGLLETGLEAHGRRNFLFIFLAESVLRVGYQIGKTPVLPIFAAQLGASEAVLGMIVSVSVCAGLVLKPFVGILSDRHGRGMWMIAAGLVFSLMPFTYILVTSPGELVAVRLLHGLATAMLGPVSLAYILSLSSEHRAARLGVFGLPRSSGYVLGPALGGVLLTCFTPASVYVVIGLISMLAMWPLVIVSRTARSFSGSTQRPYGHSLRGSLKLGWQAPSLRLVSLFECFLRIATYAVKTFLPLYALDKGMGFIEVGLILAVQEGAHMIMRPFAGMLADKWGFANAIAIGLLTVGIAVGAMGFGDHTFWFHGCGLGIGVGQAFVTPASQAIVAAHVGDANLGVGMGFVGSARNVGKIVGPAIGGLLVNMIGFQGAVSLLGPLTAVMALSALRMSNTLTDSARPGT